MWLKRLHPSLVIWPNLQHAWVSTWVAYLANIIYNNFRINYVDFLLWNILYSSSNLKCLHFHSLDTVIKLKVPPKIQAFSLGLLITFVK
jgi:hypothetical protein